MDEDSATDMSWLNMHYVTDPQTADQIRGGGSFINVTDKRAGSHTLVMMAKLGILVAVAVFLETVSATSVSDLAVIMN